jgi:hypothetical protein
VRRTPIGHPQFGYIPSSRRRRLAAEITERYGAGRTLAEISQAWRPHRTWAAVHLRALREQRSGEIAHRSATRTLSLAA